MTIRLGSIRLVLFACLGLSLLPLRAAGQTRFPIELRVEGDDGVLAEARSFFSRELRSIPDVAVVESSGDWELLVLAGELKGARGPLGILVGATLLEAVDAEESISADPQMDPELRHALSDQRWRLFKDMWLYHGGPDDMAALARRIIADIDVSVFEAER